MADDNIYTKENQIRWSTKPKPEFYAEVKKLYSSGGYSYNSLARLFKLSPQRIQQIVKDIRKKHYYPKENRPDVNQNG